MQPKGLSNRSRRKKKQEKEKLLDMEFEDKLRSMGIMDDEEDVVFKK